MMKLNFKNELNYSFTYMGSAVNRSLEYFYYQIHVLCTFQDTNVLIFNILYLDLYHT